MAPEAKESLKRVRAPKLDRANAAGFRRPIKLSANENPLGMSSKARLALRRAAFIAHRYPDAEGAALRGALAAKHDLDPERIVLGAGSSDLFALLAQAFLEPGARLLLPQYGFAAWAYIAQTQGAAVVRAPEHNFTIDVDALLRRMEPRTKLVLIANPANPTGTTLTGSEVRRLHAGLPRDVILVIDGAYAEYAAFRRFYDDGLTLAHDAENVVVTRTFSKLYGLAGLRVGWAYASSRITNTLNLIRLPYNVSAFAQAAACASLVDEDFVERSSLHAAQGVDRLMSMAADFGLDAIPSSANFVTARFPSDAALNAAQMEKRLAGVGILVRRLDDYGLPDALRISVGANVEMARLASEMGSALERRTPRRAKHAA